jgi:radical SAM superfamily enzyme YgiQ (UPF0313 family)
MRVLRATLIAPSRYEDGEVAIYRLGMNPNGALAALAGLAEDYNIRHAGRRRIDYEFFDEHVERAITADMLRRWRDAATAAGQPYVLMICGIQTTMYPRSRDLALMARREGIEVMAGGVHLSGHPPSVEFLVSCGVHVAVGEVEPIWDEIVEDALDGRLRDLYRIRADQGMQVKTVTSSITVPDIAEVPFPHIPAHARRHYVNPTQIAIDGSRGCPFLCTFCVVKNVFGRTVRNRDPARLARWMVDRVDRDGVRAFWFTDDNFVRNPRHLELLEHLAAARSKGRRFSLSLILDVESSCYARDEGARGEKTREFLRLCRAAGVAHVYMGLESTNDAALREMRKGVNRDREEIHGAGTAAASETARQRLIHRYRTAVEAWHDVGASVECGYILGFEPDSPGVGVQAAHDMVAIGVDIASFYLITPLPGSEDYARALETGTLLERDFNEYFRDKAMVGHPTMSGDDLEAELRAAVKNLWTWPRVAARLARRVLGIGGARVTTPWSYAKRQLGFKLMVNQGMLSYSQGGLLRRHGACTVPREVIADEEARRFYLGSVVAAEPTRAA